MNRLTYFHLLKYVAPSTKASSFRHCLWVYQNFKLEFDVLLKLFLTSYLEVLR